MDSTLQSNFGSPVREEKEASYASVVEPFLVEALENPRHRLTVLRMELDIQIFLRNAQQLQFEFPHFPISYLRLAAHRVAQHYGLQTMVLDKVLDGHGTKIVVRRTPESKYPSVFLSDIPAKQSESCKQEQIKIALRPRPSRTSSGDAGELGIKHSPVKIVEERKEQYDRARARIFSSSDSSTSDGAPSQVSADSTSQDDIGGRWSSVTDVENTLSSRDVGCSSRVAIFRDRGKDHADPEYDRNHERHVKSFPAGQQQLTTPFNMPNFQPSLMQFNIGYPQMGGQISRTQGSLNYGPSSDLTVNQFSCWNQSSSKQCYLHAMTKPNYDVCSFI